MSQPRRKKNLNFSKYKSGTKGKDTRSDYPYSDYWYDNERINQIFDNIQKGRGYFPQSVLHEDHDKSFLKFIEEDCKLVTKMTDPITKQSDDKVVPMFFLNLQRWKEFTKTWTLMDNKKQISLPFITVVRKLEVSRDEENQFTIPNRRLFPYMYVPTWDGNKKGVDIYQIPQPIPITMSFEVRLFSTKIRDLNRFNKILLRNFSSKQYYINVNGHYTQLTLENVGDESQIDSLDERRFYQQPYEIKLTGYLIDSEEFKVTPAITRVMAIQETTNETVLPLRRTNRPSSGSTTP